MSSIYLDIYPGEFCYITGASGSGKSTLLRSMMGDVHVDGIHAMVADTDLLRPYKPWEHKRKLGILFQDFKLLPKWTVFENLAFVLRATDWKSEKAIGERVEEIIMRVGLQDKTMSLVSSLSGGEQQRLAIARAVLNDPILILADEPTGNLDLPNADIVMNLLIDVATQNQAAVLVATHDDRIINKYRARTFRCSQQTIKEVL